MESLGPGATLGPYEIVASIGAGGMGEVYRARDTKLAREVAVKILPAEVSDDEERLARFQREAQLLACLNHPHIASIHGLEEHGGRPFLVMELVEGETLFDRLNRGRMDVDEAIALMHQVAEALEHAHAKSVVHRDLKPANVKITPEGNIKVLDFGLAKALAGDAVEGDSTELSQSPTLSRQTAAGLILGTAAYMAPEQARGKPVDERADIWAFAVVLFEMLTGKPLFTGDTVSDVLAAVLRADIDWHSLPEQTPAGLRRLLRRALERDPSERLRAIGDARLELRDARVDESPSAPTRTPRLATIALVAGALLLGGAVTWMVKPSGSTNAALVRFSMAPPGAVPRNYAVSGSPIALSPDGSLLAFAAEDALYVRRMDALAFERIDGTEGARGPFFSPDGEWIAFFADGQLKKLSLQSRATLNLADAPQGRGGAWGEDGTIVFAPNTREGLYTMSASGGEPRPLTRPDPERGVRGHRWPQLLPDERHVVVTFWGDPTSLAVVSVDTGETKLVVERAFSGRYAPPGRLVYARDDVLLSVPFDPERIEVLGEATPVLTALTFAPSDFGQIPLAIANDGTLAYVPIPPPKNRLALVDRDGQQTLAAEDVLAFSAVQFAPDGRRAAVGVWADDGGDQVWLLDLERHILTRLASVNGAVPLWSPDARRLATAEMTRIVVHALEGNRAPETWVEHSQVLLPGDWTRDGRAILYSKRDEQYYHIAMKSEDGEETMLLDGPFRERSPRLSPDGRWLAYESDENGNTEIFVRAFPSMEGQQRVSAAGGFKPIWSPEGDVLYFRDQNSLMSASITVIGDELVVGVTQSHFTIRAIEPGAFVRSYDIAPDGESFLVIVPVDSSAPEIRVVLNGIDELTGNP